tara:strand:+ start:125 stop:343 length:219 start_codon:yes stop_codon:yes gene_type:complete
MGFIEDFYAYIDDLAGIIASYFLGRLAFALFTTWCVWIAYTSQKHHLSKLGYLYLSWLLIFPWVTVFLYPLY